MAIICTPAVYTMQDEKGYLQFSKTDVERGTPKSKQHNLRKFYKIALEIEITLLWYVYDKVEN